MAEIETDPIDCPHREQARMEKHALLELKDLHGRQYSSVDNAELSQVPQLLQDRCVVKANKPPARVWQDWH
jgi:hypothetical protein